MRSKGLIAKRLLSLRKRVILVKLFLARTLNFLYWRTGLRVFRIISNRLAKGVVVRADDIYLVLSCISDLSMARPDYEKRFFDHMVRVLNSRGRGSVFIDVGASIGRHSLSIAKLFPESLIVAVEPDPDAYEALVRGIELNGVSNVKALPAALSDVDGYVALCRKLSTTESSVVECNNFLETVKVRSRRLDTLVNELGLRRVDLVKIDVEGAELKVLMGALNTLRRFKPALVVEIRERNKEEFLKLMSSLGYRCDVIDGENVSCTSAGV